MSTKFEYWDKLFKENNLQEFKKENPESIKWLKTKAISRKELLCDFIKFIGAKINIKGNKGNSLFKLVYESTFSDKEINQFLKNKHLEKIRKLPVDDVKNELYKLETYRWGGDHTNSLDKFIVKYYVKEFYKFEELEDKLKTSILYTVSGYLYNSWYNQWSSYLIENLFCEHDSVIPASGQIKNVDFFINNTPVDLKVTYMPSEKIKEQWKTIYKDTKSEISFLKSKANDLNITFDKKSNETSIRSVILSQINDIAKSDTGAQQVLNDYQDKIRNIFENIKKDKKGLIKWLYENQGEMRFGAENRLFVVLYDNNNYAESWKLKRNITLLSPVINSFIDNFKLIPIEFKFKGKNYRTNSNIIFISN